MSIDRSLKTKGALSRHRNVLSRAERIEKLKAEDRWEDGDKITGLPKVANRKAAAGKKGEEEKTAEAVAAPAAAAAAPAKGAAPAKAAAPAKK